MSYGHIFKMDSDPKFVEGISSKNHRIVPYDKLNEALMGKRLCLEYVKDSNKLNCPYWVTEKSGHLPDRVIALNHSIIDMLKMGDFPISFYLKETKSEAYQKQLMEQKVKSLSLSPNFSARQIALTFFIVSHYICDAHMPLHCDLRDMKAKVVGGNLTERRLPDALHPGIEAFWEKSMPNKRYLTIHRYTEKSIEKIVTHLPKDSLIEIEKEGSPYAINTELYRSLPNEWDEMKNICRVSYAVSREWIPQTFDEIECILGEKKCEEDAPKLKYEDIIKIISEDKFKDVTNRIFHDAIESVARLWYRAWFIFCKKPKKKKKT